MTPKEKAEELYEKFKIFHLQELSMGYSNDDGSETVIRRDSYPMQTVSDLDAKICAKMCVDEVLLALPQDLECVGNVVLDKYEFWKEVKIELDKL